MSYMSYIDYMDCKVCVMFLKICYDNGALTYFFNTPDDLRYLDYYDADLRGLVDLFNDNIKDDIIDYTSMNETELGHYDLSSERLAKHLEELNFHFTYDYDPDESWRSYSKLTSFDNKIQILYIISLV